MLDKSANSQRLSVQGGALEPIALVDAVHRVRAYCTHPYSGWAAYDLAGVLARREGHFRRVAPWDLLLANLMNGRVDIRNVADFDPEQRRSFAALIAAVPEGLPLADMSEAQLEAVADLCLFGYKGVWTAKTTKIAALYRPEAMPILDQHLAYIFGFAAIGFQRAGNLHPSRRTRITQTLSGLAATLRTHDSWMRELRDAVEDLPGLKHVSDVRLLDIVLWTTRDDQRADRAGERGRIRWSHQPERDPIPLALLQPVDIPPATVTED